MDNDVTLLAEALRSDPRRVLESAGRAIDDGDESESNRVGAALLRVEATAWAGDIDAARALMTTELPSRFGAASPVSAAMLGWWVSQLLPSIRSPLAASWRKTVDDVVVAAMQERPEEPDVLRLCISVAPFCALHGSVEAGAAVLARAVRAAERLFPLERPAACSVMADLEGRASNLLIKAGRLDTGISALDRSVALTEELAGLVAPEERIAVLTTLARRLWAGAKSLLPAGRSLDAAVRLERALMATVELSPGVSTAILRAEILTALARARAQLGQDREAVQLLEAAVELTKAHAGENPWTGKLLDRQLDELSHLQLLTGQEPEAAARRVQHNSARTGDELADRAKVVGLARALARQAEAARLAKQPDRAMTLDREAIALWEPLAADGDREARRELALGDERLGNDLHAAKRDADALAHFERAIASVEAMLADSEFMREVRIDVVLADLARCLLSRERARLPLEGVEATVDGRRRAYDLCTDLVAMDSTSELRSNNVATRLSAASELAWSLRYTGDGAAAIELLEEVVRGRQTTAVEFPDRVEVQRNLAIALRDLALARTWVGHAEQALVAADASLAVRAAMRERFGSKPARLLDVAIGFDLRAGVEVELGSHERALGSANAALAILDQLVGASPSEASYCHTACIAMEKRFDAALGLRRFDVAADAAHALAAGLERLTEQVGQTFQCRNVRAETELRFAQLHLATGHWRAAAEAARRGRLLVDELCMQDPTSRDQQALRAAVLVAEAVASVRLGNVSAAIETLRLLDAHRHVLEASTRPPRCREVLEQQNALLAGIAAHR